MHKKFDNQTIEKKWQEKWKESGIYDVGERDTSKDKEYVLVELPYPSGNLHIGHWHAFAVPDIYVRYRRMTGKQVIYPMGFDAFGLPAENAAIKNDKDPKKWTESNIEYMKEQLGSMGAAFSWNKTTSTTDEDYYKWTQWMFTKFFEKDIAYRGKGKVNWCDSCHTVIANEQVLANNTCERCGTEVEKKEMPQWMLRITDYVDRLIDDLDNLDWPEHIKESQRRWIGRSAGALLEFKVRSGKLESDVKVFTTRPDTLYGATYVVLAPEHPLVQKHKESVTNWKEVSTYIDITKKKTEQDRMDDTKEKTGVKLEGVIAINPASGEEIPVYIADYVLAGYGTGAIMAVPAHDERDFAFAQKYSITVKQVVVPCPEDLYNPPQHGMTETKREMVVVHLRDKSTGKYALLNWHGTLEGITTAIMGGVEEGQTPKEAALAEIFEEAALKNVKIIKKVSWLIGAKYCASHKGVNRHSTNHAFLAEVENIGAQGIISDKEKEKHTLIWVDESEVLSSVTPERQKYIWNQLYNETPILEEGYLLNSGEFDDMTSEEAKVAITKKVGGKMTNTYRLRDWSVGRQRYWGVPIPIVYDPEGKAHIVPREHLPWTLPEDVDFKPTGEPPLAKSKELKERTEKIFGEGWTPEVETLDTFVDSSWYFLRYIDNKNDKMFSSLKAQKDWMPVDLYFGGAEHTTMHLLYSRFWQKALLDMGLVTESEPYKHRINRGLILGPDGNKMSKSKGNVIDPDEHVKRVGADSVKMYLAFMGPYGETANYPWDMGGIAGIRRFLERVNGLSEHIADLEPEEVTKQLHKTILKLSKDIPQYKFNTAISAMMVFVNLAEKNSLKKESYEIFLKILAPFAPHLTEELWEQAGETDSIHVAQFPKADENIATDSEKTIGVQINGKMRGSITLAVDASQEDALDTAKDNELLSRWMTGEIQKVIYVQGKILNIIMKEE